MPVLITSGIVCALRAHGEHGAVARLLTPDHGLVAGYVRGGRSRALRPVLLPGNAVKAEFRARTEDQLASLTVELEHSRAPLLGEPLPAAAIDWACALTATALPEGTPYPTLYEAFDGVLGAVEAAPAARGWAAALVRYELLLLAELGFGLDLNRCAATGSADELAFVSPRSAAAVSRAGAEGYEARLLPLPPFLLQGGAGDWPQIMDGLRLTGFFLERSVLTERRADVLAARERLVDRLKRAVA
ncbi:MULTISPECIES: DNA repair protein RecO [Sphingobium]|uniref:DNA repair protein RecO n=2 Tax=Sphingobium yanoikuyae TaxID=13690 RepID=K9DCP2_SPHYA|nr:MULTISPECIES: DNA repair protein RecO [Sphingobium]EKU76672.1 DNA repair protein RecO [Sphingobium yanoikuyae ATCC 51230]WQE09295.1 DNA repair protein RecO [Sphingobium yanoikuyae]SHM25662.1 DNA replication and repair protein RecO [Sphingobium sp. YR657]